MLVYLERVGNQCWCVSRCVGGTGAVAGVYRHRKRVATGYKAGVCMGGKLECMDRV